MTTYARVIDGFALDCQIADSMADLQTRFHPEWFAQQSFGVVPDGTIHGAMSNGDGTFTNPTIVEAVIPDTPLSDMERINAILAAIADHVGVDVQAAVNQAAISKGD